MRIFKFKCLNMEIRGRSAIALYLLIALKSVLAMETTPANGTTNSYLVESCQPTFRRTWSPRCSPRRAIADHPVFDAIRADDYIKVQDLLIKQGRLAIHEQCGGDTPLHVAVKSENEGLVQLLLEYKALVNALNEYDDTPLHIAAAKGSTKIAKLLLSKGATIDISNSNGDTALLLSTCSANDELTSMLLQRGANPNTVNRQGKTLLGVALQIRDIELVSMALDFGADMNIDPKKDGNTLLHMALSQKPVEIGTMLATRWQMGRWEVRNRDGETPLLTAARFQNWEATKILVERGSSLDSVGRIIGPVLAQAVLAGQTTLVKFLLKRGAKPNQVDARGESAVTTAVRAGKHNILYLISQYKADLEQKTARGDPLLHLAIKLGVTDVVKTLMHLRVDFESRDERGNTPLHIASGKGNLYGRLLLKLGAQVNPVNRDGDTPLHVAAVTGNGKMIDILLQNGAGPMIRNGKNLLPSDVAKDSACLKDCALLYQAVGESKVSETTRINS